MFKSEVDEMKKDNEQKSDASGQTVTSESIEPTSTVGRAVPTTEATVPTTDGNAVTENAPRTDNQSGPVA